MKVTPNIDPDIATVRQLEQAREALRYYADPASWRQLETMGTHSANLDRGKKARDALAAAESPEGANAAKPLHPEQ